MKPKTKYQKSVVELSGQIPPITQAQREWAYRNCITHIARRTPRGKTTCMECTHEWMEADADKKECICPVCGMKLSIQTTLQRKFREVEYVLILTTFKGQQVMRYFIVSVDYCIGYKARYYCKEVVQRWIAPNGKHATLALARAMGFYFDLWMFGSQMELRSNLSIYDRLPYCLYPKKKYIPELKRGGFNGKFHKIHPHDFFVSLLSDNRCETLLKAGYIDLFRYFINNSRKLGDYWHSIRIAIRNGYPIKDAGMWVDYLDLLRQFGKDTRNAYYVCPADLHREHDRYVAKRRAQIDREQKEKKRQRAIEDEQRFLEEKSRFFGIEFTDGEISVRVLESVEEVMQEGDELHHCVFTNSYHLRPDSLILSACRSGVRLETIELSISRLAILQCRGLLNNETAYHSQIIDLVNKNIPIIKQRRAA